MTGVRPSADLDHENTDSEDNRWNNLRLATDSQNLANRGKQKNNTSGYKGVYWQKTMRKWCAEILVNKQKFRLGYAETPKAAHELYLVAAKEHFGEFAHA